MTDTSFIIWIQQFSTPWLDTLFRLLTYTGELEFYMATIPLFFWLFDKKFGFRFAVFFLISTYLNSAIKYNFQTERPPHELRKITQEGYSFPSGHAQGSTVYWSYLALQINKRWAYIAAGIILFLVAFSRIYLGVHFPIDMLFGILIGLSLLGLYEFFCRNLELEMKLSTWLLATGGVIAILFMNHSVGDGSMVLGFALGSLWGYRLEADFVAFQVKAAWWQHIIKAVLGLVVFFGLYYALGSVSDSLVGDDTGLAYHLFRFFRYFCLALWVTLAAPWVFKLLRLYRKI